MKKTLIALAAVGSLAVAGTAAAATGAELINSKGCGTCHAADTKKVGPSWKDIAAKNKDSKDASARIVTMLKEGKGHPKVAGSDDELKALAGFALAGGK